LLAAIPVNVIADVALRQIGDAALKDAVGIALTVMACVVSEETQLFSVTVKVRL
jgi:hypothetical protein